MSAIQAVEFCRVLGLRAELGIHGADVVVPEPLSHWLEETGLSLQKMPPATAREFIDRLQALLPQLDESMIYVLTYSLFHTFGPTNRCSVTHCTITATVDTIDVVQQSFYGWGAQRDPVTDLWSVHRDGECVKRGVTEEEAVRTLNQWITALNPVRHLG